MVAVPLTTSETHNGSISTHKTSKVSTFLSSSSSSSSSSNASATKALITTTRSLSVSFQGDSFFYHTSKEKRSSLNPTRKAMPERRKPSSAHSENSQASNQHCQSAPGTTRRFGRLEYSEEKKGTIFTAVRLLLPDGEEFCDTDSLSSGSNSEKSTPEKVPARAKAPPRGISVPARFLQGTNSRIRPLPEPALPVPSPITRKPKTPPFSAKNVASPSRSSVMVKHSNAPSIINFAAEVRSRKKGEDRIEEAHLLRLLYNRHLQWRCVNAKANAAMVAKRSAVEKCLYSAWITTSEIRDSVTSKRIKIQLLAHSSKLSSVLKGQINYLKEWSLVDEEHSCSVSGAIDALKASIIRLPIIRGARADVEAVKDAVGAAIDIMEAMSSSVSSLLSKVEGINYFVSELCKLAALEQALLSQSRDLLSTVAILHVKQCSLRGQIMQLQRRSSI